MIQVLTIMIRLSTRWHICYSGTGKFEWNIIMMTSSYGKISALLALCAGNSPVTGEFPLQCSVTHGFDIFFDLHLNKWFSKQCEADDRRRHRAHSDVTVMYLDNESMSIERHWLLAINHTDDKSTLAQVMMVRCHRNYRCVILNHIITGRWLVEKI